MQLMRLTDVPRSDRDRLFRYSPTRAVAGVSLVIAGCIWLVLFGRQTRFFLPYYVAGGFLFFALLYRRVVVARFRPSNWLVRMTERGLYVQFRSYLNYHFSAEDFTVMLIPYAEIRSIRLVRQVQQVPEGRNTSMTKIRRLVELELSVDATPLEQALSTERARQAPKQTRWFGSSSTTYRHYPVGVAPSGAVQLEWGVVPGRKNFANALRKYIAVAPPASTAQEQDYVHLDKLPREEQEEKLLELAEKGDVIAAITIARELYSYDLAGAKAFVEGLIAGKAGKGGVK